MLVSEVSINLHREGAGILCARASVQGSEFDLLGHRLAMLVADAPLGLHGQGTSVFVPKPTTDGGDIDTGFDTPDRKQMAEIVVRQPRNPNLPARSRERFVTLLQFDNAAPSPA
jgi:hypothetical protein